MPERQLPIFFKIIDAAIEPPVYLGMIFSLTNNSP